MCIKVEYFNNQIICDLVEQPHIGLLALLDEACLNVGKVTDKIFIDVLSTKLASHKHFTSRKVRTVNKDANSLVERYFFDKFFLLSILVRQFRCGRPSVCKIASEVPPSCCLRQMGNPLPVHAWISPFGTIDVRTSKKKKKKLNQRIAERQQRRKFHSVFRLLKLIMH